MFMFMFIYIKESRENRVVTKTIVHKVMEPRELEHHSGGTQIFKTYLSIVMRW